MTKFHLGAVTMKKIVFGIIIGAGLTFAVQAGAETISNVGKKVQAEYEVIVDGNPLPVKAVAVGGTTSTPNRALADAVGYDIAFKDNVVSFTKKKTEVVTVVTSSPLVDELKEVNDRILELTKQKNKIIQESVRIVGDAEPDYAEKLKALEAQGKPIQEELDALNKRKAELEAQQ
jgi:hypothetical protein